MAIARNCVLVIAAVLALAVVGCHSYNLQVNWQGTTFFDNFSFWTGDDPTHGYVNYVDRNTAEAKGYVSATANGKPVYIGADHQNVAGGRGRDSVRISSNYQWNHGLFVLDLLHMPEGCGTWPAFWMVGPNWPNMGEIDIIEGVNNNQVDQTTLHTSNGCDMAGESTNSFSGSWAPGPSGPSNNCWVNAPGQYSNAGCGITGNSNSYGVPFNNVQGGVYVLEWTGDFIRSFFFQRSNIPQDIKDQRPNPNNWGKPYAYFQLGGNCPASHFQQQQVVINLTFCGDWAGGVFGQQCPGKGSCQSYVQNNPGAFGDAYWLINSLAVYQ